MIELAIKHTRKPDIRFYENGKIDLRKTVTRPLSLRIGDYVNIANVDGECYLFRHGDSSEMVGDHKARVCNVSGQFMRVWSKELCNYIASLTGDKQNWLFVGEVTRVNGIGIALPIILRNNQYRDD